MRFSSAIAPVLCDPVACDPVGCGRSLKGFEKLRPKSLFPRAIARHTAKLVKPLAGESRHHAPRTPRSHNICRHVRSTSRVFQPTTRRLPHERQNDYSVYYRKTPIRPIRFPVAGRPNVRPPAGWAASGRLLQTVAQKRLVIGSSRQFRRRGLAKNRRTGRPWRTLQCSVRLATRITSSSVVMPRITF
jgi:hypothetical protein